DLGAECAAERDGNRIHQPSIDEPPAAIAMRREQAGHRYGGADRFEERAVAEPDLAAGLEIGRDGGERLVEPLDRAIGLAVAQLLEDPSAGDEPAAARRQVHEADDVEPANRAHPGLERLEPAGDVGSSDQGADRRAGDDLRLDAGIGESAQNADVRPAARGATAERDADAGACPGGRRRGRLRRSRPDLALRPWPSRHAGRYQLSL